MGINARSMETILPQQGSYKTTGQGLKDIAGTALGSALELGIFSKGAKLAQAGLKGTKAVKGFIAVRPLN